MIATVLACLALLLVLPACTCGGPFDRGTVCVKGDK
jgi:hypothetical protein